MFFRMWSSITSSRRGVIARNCNDTRLMSSLSVAAGKQETIVTIKNKSKLESTDAKLMSMSSSMSEEHEQEQRRRENSPKILITGGLGQIGTELATRLRGLYGRDNVWASDVMKPPLKFRESGPFVFVDVLSSRKLEEVVVDQGIDWLLHLPSILSARGELDPERAWNVNIEGVRHAFQLACKHQLRLFIPSSIAVFGPSTPKVAPDICPMDPDTMYGLTKRSMELLGCYYAKKNGLDFRSLRYPGIISHRTPPGGGTTDYAVDIFYHALQHGSYNCYLRDDSAMPMMMIDDCLDATVKLLQAPRETLSQSVYNLTALSFTPDELATAIRRFIPDFDISYAPDFRQDIADSWPHALDDSAFRRDLQWQPEYATVDQLADLMIRELSRKFSKK